MTESTQYGVRFTDGSVWHPWNGRTQEQRAREALAELRAEYPRDADRLTLVVRSAADKPWTELTPMTDAAHCYTPSWCKCPDEPKCQLCKRGRCPVEPEPSEADDD